MFPLVSNSLPLEGEPMSEFTGFVPFSARPMPPLVHDFVPELGCPLNVTHDVIMLLHCNKLRPFTKTVFKQLFIINEEDCLSGLLLSYSQKLFSLREAFQPQDGDLIAAKLELLEYNIVDSDLGFNPSEQWLL